MKPSEIIRGGKNEMFTRGRARGKFIDQHGQVCALASVGIAALGEEQFGEGHWWLFEQPGPLREAVTFLSTTSGRNFTECVDNVYARNDRADDFDDVVEWFDKAEKLAEASEASA